MTPIHALKPENIRGAVYIDAGTPGEINSVKFIMFDGNVNIYAGEDLLMALALARERFPAAPGLNKTD